MKKISVQEARQKAVANVVASLQMEGLTPRQSVVHGLSDCLVGTRSFSTMVKETVAFHQQKTPGDGGSELNQ